MLAACIAPRAAARAVVITLVIANGLPRHGTRAALTNYSRALQAAMMIVVGIVAVSGWPR